MQNSGFGSMPRRPSTSMPSWCMRIRTSSSRSYASLRLSGPTGIRRVQRSGPCSARRLSASMSSSEPAVRFATTSNFVCQATGPLLVSDDTDDVTPSGVRPCPVERSVECHVASVRRPRAARITVTIPAMPAELNGARVLLTGATGGIGNAIAEELHRRGAHVLATGRRREALEELEAEPLVADLSERDAVTSLIDRAG